MTELQGSFDIAVIGAGMGGASIASELSATHKVLLLEREDQPGYHATGRSAAVYSAIYGNSVVRALSRASSNFLTAPPSDLTDQKLVAPLGSMLIARSDQLDRLEAFYQIPDVVKVTSYLSGSESRGICPILNDNYVSAALYESGALSIDVDALHQAYLRNIRRNGGVIATRAELVDLNYANNLWSLGTTAGLFRASAVVNSAGAWADTVARLAGCSKSYIQPFRRTAILVDPPSNAIIHGWPLVIDIDEEFYFKPDAGALLLSPADESESDPCDAQPEEWDIAIAVDRVCKATSLEVKRVRNSWAGLRSFTVDRIPLAGPDLSLPSFYWLAGQGGYGIQTAPALARLLAAYIRGELCPAEIADEGLDYENLALRRVLPG